MVRIGGMAYAIDPNATIGNRISDMTLLADGTPIEAGKSYVVAGWASVNEGTEGPAIWDVVEDHLKERKTVSLEPNRAVRVSGL